MFQVLERGTRDYWFKVELEDGTSGWILGDLVFPFEVGDEEEPGAFARDGPRDPARDPRAVAGRRTRTSACRSRRACSTNEGVFLLRPSWLIDPYWALEAFAGLSPRSENEPLPRRARRSCCAWRPGAVIGPYASLGLGAAYIRPKADNYVGQEGTLMALGAGGGLEITFKKQITLRLDVAQLDDLRPEQVDQRPGVLRRTGDLLLGAHHARSPLILVVRSLPAAAATPCARRRRSSSPIR